MRLKIFIVLFICLHPFNSFGVDWKCLEGDCDNGQGVLVSRFPDVEEAKYVGGFKDGSFHGQGTLTIGNGTKYVGRFKKGKFHGRGTETDVIGVKYVGDFENGKRHGHGILTFSYAGDYKYVGNFKDGVKHGYGVEGMADGSSNIGYWLHGVYTGKDKPEDIE